MPGIVPHLGHVNVPGVSAAEPPQKTYCSSFRSLLLAGTTFIVSTYLDELLERHDAHTAAAV